MISPLPSFDDELLNSAYANISLIADKAWTFDKEDTYQKLNQSLWIQSCKLTAKYKENGNCRTKRVRDVIPDSFLAKYGNYEYNENREKLYQSDRNATSVPLPNFCWTEVTEPWMLPEVEEQFARIVSNVVQSNREFSAIKGPESDNPSKTGCCFKSRLKDFLQKNQRSAGQKLSSPEKRKIEGNYESRLTDKTSGIETYEQSLETEGCHNHRYAIDSPAEMQLHNRITSGAVRNLWNPAKTQRQYNQHAMRLPCSQQQQKRSNRREQNSQGRERQQQFYYAFQYQPLILRTEYQSARSDAYGMTRKHLPPVLSPEVPEFFPKISATRFASNKDQNGNRIQYFPSLNERSYQNELFPYNRAPENTGLVYQNTGIPMLPATDATTFARSHQQWFQRIPPPTQMQISASSSAPLSTSVQPLRATTISHHPLQMQEKFLQPSPTPIPVYQHPIELYHETAQKRKNQGVDFKNLILLTKNAMKAHRSQSKNPQQVSGYVLDSKNQNSRQEREVLHWLNKSCPTKSKEFVAVNALVSELRGFEEKCDYGKISGSWKGIDETAGKSERLKPETGVSVKNSNKRWHSEKNKTDNRSRRLYRDVLANTSTSDAALENVFEKRYDELEQQAMEQYRTSEESLALKYQELERQAVEQYKCGSGAQELSSTSQILEDSKQGNESNKYLPNTDCSDGHRCSGIGGCSPVNKDEKAEQESLKKPKITLLKPDNDKSGSSVRNKSSLSRNSRPTVVSKSLTKLTQEISYGSKNASRGASGDKIDKSGKCNYPRDDVRASSKRRLILVSPFQRESEPKLTKTTDLEEFYCISQANKNILNYYENSKIGKSGAGDEKITILQSPRTEGTSFASFDQTYVYSKNAGLVYV